nr:ankyrin repeat protein [Pandoravirus massiliensis]
MAMAKQHGRHRPWLRANGYPWDADTCYKAAYGGHLHVLQWARANGAHWDGGVYYIDHMHIIKWIKANGGADPY